MQISMELIKFNSCVADPGLVSCQHYQFAIEKFIDCALISTRTDGYCFCISDDKLFNNFIHSCM
ncbi:hypothetical protein CMV30_10315 [Nibricoccus aquaticus]|uniref:Uncharacterized protein n=1 Tax=Nibricoccus aquaticus TaxID=2576891 RepID=A0A290QDI7_9BACT|nr:hypothetical protein CMV30_10315 [Nibricoccus aquaticus]